MCFFLNFIFFQNEIDNAVKSTIDKHIWLRNLQDTNEDLFLSLLLSNPHKYLPIVYTPTVGEACTMFSQITPANSHGIYITPEDSNIMEKVLQSWPNASNVKIIVVTDGSRILGLGDLGADGMGIPIGKASLYAAAGGFDPSTVVPVTLDFGCSTRGEDRESFPDYLGFPYARLDDATVTDLVDRFVSAVKLVFPKAVLQWEDFHLNRAFHLLDRHQKSLPSFNDDIQGTASVVLGGLLSAIRLAAGDVESNTASNTHSKALLSHHTFLFVGSGSATLGVVDLLVEAMISLEGLSASDARDKIYLSDSKGLITLKRKEGIEGLKKIYARRDAPDMGNDLYKIVNFVKPSVLIGLAANGPIFTPKILTLMNIISYRPIVFALSNPTSKAECSAQDAFEASQGRIIFASGSPLPPPQETEGEDASEFAPPPVTSQCNNMFIFPGVGLAASAGRFSHIPNSMFLHAAVAMSRRVSDSWLSQGVLFPPLESLRAVSRSIAESLIIEGVKEGISPLATPLDSADYIASKSRMLVEESLWAPSDSVELSGSNPAEAMAILKETILVDRSVKRNGMDNILADTNIKRGSKEYASAPWKVRKFAKTFEEMPPASNIRKSKSGGGLIDEKSSIWGVFNWIFGSLLVGFLLFVVRKNKIF